MRRDERCFFLSLKKFAIYRDINEDKKIKRLSFCHAQISLRHKPYSFTNHIQERAMHAVLKVLLHIRNA